MIYIIGLGAGSEKHLTKETIDVLKDSSRHLFLRTEIHPTVSYLKEENITYKSFDYLYGEAQDFEYIYKTIAAELVTLAQIEEVTYAVPGNPLVAERSVFMILEEAKENNVPVKVFPALSSLEAIYSALQTDPLEGLLIADATNFKPSRLSKAISCLIVQVYAKHIASDVKLSLMDIYPDTYPITVVKAAGIEGEERIETIPLYMLDRIDWIDHLTSVFIKANQFPLPDDDMEISGNTQIERLVNIVSYLRSPDGCPWDREQTHESIRKHIVEEAYEVIEAIENKDTDMIRDELGDLLLQVVLHSQIASEEGTFDFEDVSESISDKLIRRHPHVFEKKDDSITDGAEVKNLWEKLKNKEKAHHESILDGIPRALPSLMRAEKVQRKAASVGFDWEDVKGVLDKVEEEIKELQNAIAFNNKESVTEEIGDLLFTIINFSRWNKVDPEEAMTRATEKFIHRFRRVESKIKSENKKFEDFNIEQLEEFWKEAKESH